jgi:hypothetical protein
MKSRSDEIREYLANHCPEEQDSFNPKVYSHLKGISGFDYLFCEFDNVYGYALVLINGSYLGSVPEFAEITIEQLVEDHVIIIKKSKYIGKRVNKVKKTVRKGA